MSVIFNVFSNVFIYNALLAGFMDPLEKRLEKMSEGDRSSAVSGLEDLYALLLNMRKSRDIDSKFERFNGDFQALYSSLFSGEAVEENTLASYFDKARNRFVNYVTCRISRDITLRNQMRIAVRRGNDYITSIEKKLDELKIPYRRE